MSQKFRCTIPVRSYSVAREIPVQFELRAAGFEVPIKKSDAGALAGWDAPLLAGRGPLRFRADGGRALPGILAFRKEVTTASVTLPEPLLDRGVDRYNRCLKSVRKKR
ncbi:MAG: hypothetical protein ACREE6_14115 [Limisphaerales bacterium]